MAILDKKRIRKKILRERKELSDKQVKNMSETIINKLKKIPVYKNSKTVMVYLSFGNEVESKEIIKNCLENDKRVVLPFCDNTDMSITPTEIKSLDIDLVEDSIGYIQPNKETLDPVDLSEIDLIIVPGISFDRKGYRIGFGAGYYDRFLGRVNFEIPTIGLAYDFQIIDSLIEMEDYDVPVDYVMTEERIIVRTE